MTQLARFITLAFVLLAVALAASLAGYWRLGLQPSLFRESQYQADLMAQAQAERLAERIVEGDESGRPDAVSSALDEILSFTEVTSGKPFFAAIVVELDPSVSGLDALLWRAGETGCADCFVSEISLLDPRDYRLMGIARFLVTSSFYRAHLADFRLHLLIQGAVALALLVIAWASVVALTVQVERQRGERRRAEQAALRTRARYQRLLDNLSGYFVYSRSSLGDIEFVSDSVRQVLGFEPDVFCRQFNEHVVENVWTDARLTTPASEPEASSHSVLALRDSDGKIRYLECAETLVANSAGTEAVIEGIARDVSTQKALEASLREAKERAESANQAKSALLANVSHELRTPMASIIGLGKLLLKTELSPRARDSVLKIVEAAESLLTILDDILDISKMEAGRVSLEQKDFVLDDVLDQLANIAAMRAEGKALELNFAISPRVPQQLRGDPVRLGQVLLNLTSNAIKFTPSGHVLVCVESLERRPDTARLRFSVEDTGIGVAEKDMPLLFTPFTQLDGSSSRRYGGAGLGLTIARHLVEQMDGDIGVESTPGRGSRFQFTVRFPRAPEDPLDPPTRAVSAAGLRVLIACDYELTQQVFAQSLNELGFAIALAASARELDAALREASANRQPIDLVLLAVTLGERAAHDILSDLRRDAALRPLPPVLVLGRFDACSPSLEDATLGIAGYLAQPITPTRLLRAIEPVLGETSIAADSMASPAVATPFWRGAKVLVAEDHSVNRGIAVDVLTGLGLEVEAVADGLTALQRLAEGGFAAVLMDVQMPRLDGLEATRRLRADPQLADLPVIALTAHAMIGDAERFRAAGMTDVLSKPLEEAELIRVLRRCLPLSAHRRGEVTREAAPAGWRASAREAMEQTERVALERSDREPSQADLAQQHAITMIRARGALACGHRADAIALIHRFKALAEDLGAEALTERALALELAIAKGKDLEEPWRRLVQALDLLGTR